MTVDAEKNWLVFMKCQTAEDILQEKKTFYLNFLEV